MTLEALAKQGQTTVYNSLVASIGPKIREIRKEYIKESFYGFQQVEHRLELVAVIHGIEFINDSKSTNINGTWFAMESTSRPVIWIVGGVDSGNDYSVLRHLVRTNVKGIICLGKDNGRIHEAFDQFNLPMADVLTMDEAVQSAYYMGDTGDVVLLSPACASFDLFENYEERGAAFRSSVKNL
ncbi:MAG: cyanophycin synthetase [Bacteroidota bacterium]